MASLQLILDRLDSEGLHGPESPFSPLGLAHSHPLPPLPPHANGGPLNVNVNGATAEAIEEDVEADDPRWFDLFKEHFVENSDSRNDDLLFFVRKFEREDLDPVFVKRKQPAPNMMPPIDDVVLWRETFFLNLIVQLPCKLTVAVCKRVEPAGPGQKTSMTCSRKHVSKRVYALPTKSRMDVKESSVECSYPLIYYVIDDYEDMFEQLVVMEGEYLCVELAVTIPNDLERTRRSAGDLGDHDTLADDEDLDDDVPEEDDDVSDIENYEPMATPHGSMRSSSMLKSHSSLPAINPYANNYPYSTPFPQPSTQRDTKITLFQGAASYSALLDIYKQRTAPKLASRRFKNIPFSPPTEYVMMRGPGGKGHAQVAITAAARDTDVVFQQPNSTASSRPTSRRGSQAPSAANSTTSSAHASPVLAPSKSVPPPPQVQAGAEEGGFDTAEKPKAPTRSSSTNSFFQTFKRLSLTAVVAGREREDGRAGQVAGEVNVQSPEALKCCMTFVNVPWTSIIR
ncbi:hypothetical protein BC936DRAFT_143216 [Jimgerdemannia flammicorona]|uniref:Uncharacterized protein n=2 Tax=Jimgerdemannia flammicorona TaxID=994334 RepID=A0A433PD84_9FUNG|nr:hypothetical protein BC936DRAFT_143216 [Jimgerdemannia flammicorona]RUS15476.1 hypothetical protein BC938DRAFT_476928 [Jimgerdemannia flammicorona]